MKLGGGGVNGRNVWPSRTFQQEAAPVEGGVCMSVCAVGGRQARWRLNKGWLGSPSRLCPGRGSQARVYIAGERSPDPELESRGARSVGIYEDSGVVVGGWTRSRRMRSGGRLCL